MAVELLSPVTGSSLARMGVASPPTMVASAWLGFTVPLDSDSAVVSEAFAASVASNTGVCSAAGAGVSSTVFGTSDMVRGIRRRYGEGCSEDSVMENLHEVELVDGR